jgi:hypothetical protein
MPEFLMQVAQRLLVILYRELCRINLVEEVHVRVRMHLPGIRVHYDFLEAFNIQLGLEDGERLLVLREFLAGCGESRFPIRCELRNVVCRLGLRFGGT